MKQFLGNNWVAISLFISDYRILVVRYKKTKIFYFIYIKFITNKTQLKWSGYTENYLYSCDRFATKD